jgi:hypothetical protein
MAHGLDVVHMQTNYTQVSWQKQTVREVLMLTGTVHWICKGFPSDLLQT